nr:unnamed protein product [Digitaria exilis]
MKHHRRLIDGLRLFKCRRSTHLIPERCGHPRGPSNSPSCPSTCPSNDSSSITTTSSRTTAESHTSIGHRLRVSFDLVAPPAISLLRYTCTETTPEDEFSDHDVIAAHGDTVVAAQPGGRRCPGWQFVVARIKVLAEHNGGHGMANLCVLRPGSSQWEHKRLVPIAHEEGDELMEPLSGPDMALPVGDRFLCWEYCPKLRHVPLPVLSYDPDCYTNDLPPLTDSQSMGVAGDSAVRFVAIEPRCCCGGFGRCSCPKSRHAFTVTTWTLTLTMDEPIAWVKDTVMDCEELWALPGYEGIPRLHLQSPIVSLDKLDIIWFRVDTRRKDIVATVLQSTIGPWRSYNPYCLRQVKLQ